MPTVGRSQRRVGEGNASASKAAPSSNPTPKERSQQAKSDMNKRPPNSFLIFRRLPAELRIHIWELSHSAVIGHGLIHNISQKRKYDRFITDGHNAAARAILSVDRESRHVALKALPDAVPHPNGKGVIRANLERDIFLVCDRTVSAWHNSFELSRDPFSQRSLYFVVEDSRFTTKELRWCAYEDAKSSATISFKHVVDASGRGPARDPRWFSPTDLDSNPEKLPARSRAYRQIYCWSGVDALYGPAESKLPWDHLQRMQGVLELRCWRLGREDPDLCRLLGRGYETVDMPTWPLVEWGEHGLGRLEKVLSWNGNEDEWEDTDCERDASDEEVPEVPDESDKSSEYSPKGSRAWNKRWGY
ncbi:hypothetical protein QBC43DRAFT_305077 [Cladorrhinum sp. PSN259]|nr:hypothetical protein QBC43DRAFT_305077 [Cladorrhinum sp. PSN259]